VPSVDPNLGRLVDGKFQLVRHLGGGGMGAVYEARNVKFGKRVAIKLIDNGADASGELTERLRREARAAARIESDGIVQVFDVGDDPELGTFLVMEYLLGEGLDARIVRGALPVMEAIDVVHRVARVLSRAHAAGILHRDLKPANIFLVTREDGTQHVKVLDFGLAKVLGDEANLRLTRAGSLLGTPAYMSPEQARGVEDLDHRTDLWSLGLIFYECLSGRPAYGAHANVQETLLQIVGHRPYPLASLAPWVPAPVVEVVEALIVHDRAQRLADGPTLIRRLNALRPGG
jgi:serine/threonine-protein kinase